MKRLLLEPFSAPVVNGGFESGNQSFGTGYRYVPPGFFIDPAGEYAIWTTPFGVSVYNDWQSFGDHTSGYGNMFIANGATAAGTLVWFQTVAPIMPQTTYLFSFWGATVNQSSSSPATLQASVNGANLAGPLTLPTAAFPAGGSPWQPYFGLWFSGNCGTSGIYACFGAEMEIVDTNLSSAWNDFALDDISLVPDPVVNGAFESGNLGFGNGYTYVAPGTQIGNAAEYAIGTNPSTASIWGTSWVAVGDHTTGTGNMLMVNGATTSGTAAFGESGIPVQPNTTYALSFWAMNLDQSSPSYATPALQASVNGSTLAGTLTLPQTGGSWSQYLGTWTSGSSTTAAQIEIVDTNTSSAWNDFAIDDVSFAAE